MTANYVLLTVDEADGSGNPVTTGSATFTPSVALTDPTDQMNVIGPVTVHFRAGIFPVAKLLATDNTGPQPSGWGWTVTFSGVPGNPASFTFFLPFTSGSSQRLSAQTPVSSVTTMQAYMPLPTGAATAGYVPVATGTGEASAWGPQSGGGGTSIYPANEKNTGYQNAPGYPGSLTSSAGILPLASNATYSFYNFPAGLNDASFADSTGAHDVTFIGCRFASNQVSDANVYTVGNNITYSYCTFEPSTVAAGSEPAISNTGYQIAYGQGYQYGINQNSTGPITVDHCRMWGYANAIQIGASTKTVPFRILNSLFQNPGANGGVYHTDGPGQLNGLSGINGGVIQNCTIIGLGNTNGIALQAGTYDSWLVSGNYLAGYGFMVALGTVTGNQTNFTFANNTWGSDPLLEPGGVGDQPNGGPLYPGSVGSFNGTSYGNYWYGNKISTAAGNTWMSAANDGLYWWPTDNNPAGATSIVGHDTDFDAPYLPRPSGTPSSGQVPVATGSGEATAWGTAVFIPPSGDNTGATDTAAINAVAQAGKAAILTSGTYYVTHLLPDSLGAINGQGAGTILQAVSGTTGYMIALKTPASTYQVDLRNLTLIPNTGSLGGVHIDNTGFTGGGGATDPQHTLQGVYVRNAGGDAFHFGANARSMRITDCRQYHAGGSGFAFETGATDNTVTGCVSGPSAGHGFSLAGWNNFFSGCKAFYAGYNGSVFDTGHSAWEITGSYNTLASCCGENGALHGFDLNGCSNTALAGCNADSNNSGGSGGVGINTNGATYCTVTGCVGDNHGGSGQTYGIQVAGTQTGTAFCFNSVTGSSGTFNYVSGFGYTLVSQNTVDFSGAALVKTSAPALNTGNVQALSNSSTIATGANGILPVSETGNVTGIILAAPSNGNVLATVVNRSNFTITFAASGTSGVADGASDVIPALTARTYAYDSGTSLWYRSA